jgi:hypothetical protein
MSGKKAKETKLLLPRLRAQHKVLLPISAKLKTAAASLK